MRVRALVGLVLVALPLAAMPAAAECTVVSPSASPDINYTTLCLQDSGEFGDGTQTFTHEYVAHASHAVELDPAFDYAYVRSDQGTWTYDDGEVRHEREYTHVGAGTFQGVRGLVGWGTHANLNQREQSAAEDAGDACSSHVGRSTCLGGGGWFTAQDVASVGLGVYYQQTGTGAGCTEAFSIYVSLLITTIPVTPAGQPCTSELPYLYEAVPFGELPVLV